MSASALTHACGRASSRRPTMRASACSFALDELDLVAVGVFDEGDHRRAALHRPGLARHFAAAFTHALARGRDVGHADRHMPESVAEVIALDAAAVGELEHRRALLVVVAAEGERVLLLLAVGGAQELHAEHVGVELDRAL